MDIYDSLNRPLRDLRISVTDRCNFRCTYCMPKEIYNNDYNYLNKNEILSFIKRRNSSAISANFFLSDKN